MSDDQLRAIINQLEDRAAKSAADAVRDRIADSTHSAVYAEATAATLVNVVLMLKPHLLP